MGPTPAGGLDPTSSHIPPMHTALNWVPWRRRAFWVTQALVLATLAVHLVANELYHHGLIQVPPFVTLVLTIVPVSYAALRFGLRGSLSTAGWIGALLAPNWILLDSTLLFWAEATILVLLLAIGMVAGWLVDLQRAETTRLVEAGRVRGMERVAEQLPDGVCLTDAASNIMYVNPAWAALQGLGSSQDAVGVPMASFHKHEGAGRGHLPYELEIPAERPGQSIVSHQRPDGSQFWAAVVTAPMLDEKGRLVGRLSTVRDITEDHDAAVALQEAEQRLRLTFERAPMGIATVTLDGRFMQVNDAFCQMLGRTAEEILALGVRGLTSAGELAQTEDVLAGREPGTRFIKHFIHGDGHLVSVEVTLSLMHRPDGEPWYRITHYRDVTQEQERWQELIKQAFHDPLTGLPNRLLLEDRLTQALTRTGRRRRQVGVLFCDLDGFKAINDRLGHQVGDEILRGVATRLVGSVRGMDTVARIGGDEFVVLLDSVTVPAQATEVAARILDAIRQPTMVGQEQVPLGISIGIAISSEGGKPGELLRAADSAMYSAKMDGGDGFRLLPSAAVPAAASKVAGGRVRKTKRSRVPSPDHTPSIPTTTPEGGAEAG